MFHSVIWATYGISETIRYGLALSFAVTAGLTIAGRRWVGIAFIRSHDPPQLLAVLASCDLLAVIFLAIESTVIWGDLLAGAIIAYRGLCSPPHPVLAKTMFVALAFGLLLVANL